MSLRVRLFLSHAIVIISGLLVLSAALLVLLIDYQQRLMVRELSFVVVTLVRAVRIANNNDNVDSVMDRLSRVGQAQRFQLLLMDSNGAVLRSDGFSAEAALVGRTIDLTHRVNAATDATTSATAANRETAATGDFRDGQKRRWIFVAAAIRPALPTSNWIAIARPAVSGPLISLLGEGLTLPFIEAGAVALIVAGIMAALVARSIAKPIQNVAAGANAIAQGRYEQRVARSGPPEVRQLADDFNQMAARVQGAQKMERDFVANVSHELKTPLTSIKGFAQAIQDGAVSDAASTQSAARIIHDEAERLSRLVTSLLESARLETGDVQMALHPVSLDEIARRCVEKLTPRTEASGIHLDMRLGSTPTIQADGDRLAQVVTNLLDNALKHTPSGGKVTLETKSAPAIKTHPAGVELSVADTGEGIPAEDVPRIFERFYQVDKARTQNDSATPSGTGLGLTICKQIVEAHHGVISAQSVLGIGTRISVWLPAGDSTPQGGATSRAA
jgi:signal transduction histidine kinase